MATSAPLLLTKRGMKDLKKEITQLERDQKRLITTLKETDKSDDHEARLTRSELLSQLDGVNSELSEKRHSQATAKPFPRRRDALSVAIGSIVELIDTNGRIVRYHLVDSFEADPSDGRISAKSPLGSSLLGKRLHDVIEWTAGMNQRSLRLVRIM